MVSLHIYGAHQLVYHLPCTRTHICLPLEPEGDAISRPATSGLGLTKPRPPGNGCGRRRDAMGDPGEDVPAMGEPDGDVVLLVGACERARPPLALRCVALLPLRTAAADARGSGPDARRRSGAGAAPRASGLLRIVSLAHGARAPPAPRPDGNASGLSRSTFAPDGVEGSSASRAACHGLPGTLADSSDEVVEPGRGPPPEEPPRAP